MIYAIDAKIHQDCLRNMVDQNLQGIYNQVFEQHQWQSMNNLQPDPTYGGGSSKEKV